MHQHSPFPCVLCVQELYESLEKLRPKLFRLASETAEEDTEALSEYFHVFVVVLYLHNVTQ